MQIIDDADGEVIRLTKDGRRIKDGKISKEIFDLEKHKQRKAKKAKDKQMLEKSYEEEYEEEFIDDEGNVIKVKKKVKYDILKENVFANVYTTPNLPKLRLSCSIRTLSQVFPLPGSF